MFLGRFKRFLSFGRWKSSSLIQSLKSYPKLGPPVRGAAFLNVLATEGLTPGNYGVTAHLNFIGSDQSSIHYSKSNVFLLTDQRRMTQIYLRREQTKLKN